MPRQETPNHERAALIIESAQNRLPTIEESPIAYGLFCPGQLSREDKILQFLKIQETHFFRSFVEEFRKLLTAMIGRIIDPSVLKMRGGDFARSLDSYLMYTPSSENTVQISLSTQDIQETQYALGIGDMISHLRTLFLLQTIHSGSEKKAYEKMHDDLEKSYEEVMQEIVSKMKNTSYQQNPTLWEMINQSLNFLQQQYHKKMLYILLFGNLTSDTSKERELLRDIAFEPTDMRAVACAKIRHLIEQSQFIEVIQLFREKRQLSRIFEEQSDLYPASPFVSDMQEIVYQLACNFRQQNPALLESAEIYTFLDSDNEFSEKETEHGITPFLYEYLSASREHSSHIADLINQKKWQDAFDIVQNEGNNIFLRLVASDFLAERVEQISKEIIINNKDFILHFNLAEEDQYKKKEYEFAHDGIASNMSYIEDIQYLKSK